MKKDKLSIKIKVAEGKDVDLFWELFRPSIKSQFPEYSIRAQNEFLIKLWSKNNLKERLKRRNLIILMAFSDKESAGYLMAGLPIGGVSLIIWLAVKTSLQGKGIGRSLLRGYEKVAKKQGVHKIHLWTSRRNLKFYKKQGYKLVGFVPQNYYGADDHLFYKTIQRPKY